MALQPTTLAFPTSSSSIICVTPFIGVLKVKQNVKVVFIHALRHTVEWTYSATHSWLRQQVEVSGHLQAPAVLPSIKDPCIHWMVDWVGHRAGLDVSEKRTVSYSCRVSNPCKICNSYLKYIILYYIILYYIILYYIILYYVILYYIILYYIILYCIILKYTKFRYVILCYVILRYVVLRFVTLCYVVLC